MRLYISYCVKRTDCNKCTVQKCSMVTIFHYIPGIFGYVGNFSKSEIAITRIQVAYEVFNYAFSIIFLIFRRFFVSKLCTFDKKSKIKDSSTQNK